MEIHFDFPFECYISGSNKEALSLNATFEDSGYSIYIALPVEEEKIYELTEASDEDKYFVQISNIGFKLEPFSTGADQKFNRDSLKTDQEEKERLFKLLVRIINRALQAIRNFGITPHIQIINPDISKVDSYFSLWKVRIKENSNEKPVVEEQNLLGLALAGFYPMLEGKNTPNLHTFRWPDIEEALQDNSEPPPEKEFFTNTLEFLRIRNFRMALLESIICLEIVLTQYLKSFLKVKKNISDKRIKNFLKPEVGLTTKVSVILELVLDKEDLSDINIDKILKAISLRNGVVHKTGQIPEREGETELRDYISHVIALSQILARKKRQIETEPALQAIAKDVAEKNKVPMPNIWHIGRHFYSININFFFHEIPAKNVLEKVASGLIEKLKEYDNRFVSGKQLFLRFEKFPNKIYARWRNEAIEILEEEKSA